jgi:hypothetical protein
MEIRENAPDYCDLIIIGNKVKLKNILILHWNSEAFYNIEFLKLFKADIKSDGPLTRTLTNISKKLNIDYMQTSSLWDRAYLRDHLNAGIQEIIVGKLEGIFKKIYDSTS